jgi:hypothetical protein
MHMVSFSIGSTPSDAPCAQTGITANWVYLQQLECTVYRAALIARFGVPPGGARLAIKTHSHDFGSYAQVEIVFDRDDAESVAYFEQIEDGLSTWLEANFTAPVDYDSRAQERAGSRRDAGEVITAALMTSQQLVNSGHATEREHDAIRHLGAAYPACAAEAASRLLAIPASRNVMPKTMAALDRLQAAVDQMSDRRNGN